MYLNDTLVKQIHVYRRIQDRMDKYKHIENILLYYDSCVYISEKKERCYHYWNWTKMELIQECKDK